MNIDTNIPKNTLYKYTLVENSEENRTIDSNNQTLENIRRKYKDKILARASSFSRTHHRCSLFLWTIGNTHTHKLIFVMYKKK